MITIKRVEKTKISNNKNIGRSIEIKQKVKILYQRKNNTKINKHLIYLKYLLKKKEPIIFPLE